MALFGKQYTVTAAAVQPFPTDHSPVQEIQFRTPAANSGSVFIGNSNVTASANILIEVAKGTTVVSGPHLKSGPHLDEFYVIGTNNDNLYIFYVPM